jgi:RHS repeat-associated protein
VAALAALSLWLLSSRIGAVDPEVSISSDGTNAVLTWQTFPSNVYHLQSRTNLQTNSWQIVTTLVATGTTLSWTNPLGTNLSQFFRLSFAGSSLKSVEPSALSTNGGVTVYFLGMNLDENDFIRVGGQVVSNLQHLGATSFSGDAPALAPGFYDVELVNGQTGEVIATLANGIEVLADAGLRVLEPPEKPPGSPLSSPGLCELETGRGDRDFHLFSGEICHAAVDLRIKGRGLDFIWARRYRSRIGPATALGHGWDFSYNIRVETNGSNVVVSDGWGRRDAFFQQPDGRYARNEFFQEGTLSNDVFRLIFADKGLWEFRPFDGGAAEGRIAVIRDRNSNSLSFAYDPFGRLTNITDTLDRNITVAYDASNRVSSVTDFAGRQVVYEYYGSGDTNGSAGDLKSVRSPVVTGTPNGNDFPGGKTNQCTYSTGFADERLNHNLLTITDPRGQTWLRLSYATNLDPPEVNFDRIERVSLGDLTNILDYVYAPQTAGPGNQFAVIKVIENDRVGNVTEYFYDSLNRLVRQLDYTGRAVADQPTTESTNRPTAKLRAEDPDFFETRYAWNADSLPTQIVHPNSNSTENVYELDLDPNAPRRARGNLRVRRQLPGPLGGDQSALVELFEYDTGFGGCCGFNFVTTHTDARSNVTLHAYDANGNRLHTQHRIPSIVEDWEYNAFGQVTAHELPDNGSTHRRRDEFTYYNAGPQRGYPSQYIVDAGGFNLTTTFEYDSVGNLVRQIDPRGHDTLYTVNALNQTVREQSREVTNGSGVRHEKLLWYDANDNVVRTDMENRDGAGVLQSNTHFSILVEYEILNRPERRTEEKGAANLSNSVVRLADIPAPERPQFVVTEFEYDANRNQTRVRLPEAVNTNQPANQLQTLYDERDLVYREVRAPGDPAQSTTQRDYDANGNLRRTQEGLESDPRPTTYAYDGFNRRVSATDAMGNVTTWHYDANGNITSERVDGELVDAVGGAGNVRLREKSMVHDAMDRLTRTDGAFFDPQTQVALSDSNSTTRVFYNDNSQVVRVEDDNSHSTTTTYDTANRRLVVTDAKTNVTVFAYDANDNVIGRSETDKSDLGNPDQTFATTNTYDNLDRLIRRQDNVGNAERFAYESRNNKVRVTDARGNVMVYAFDGLNRHVQSARTLTSTGDGLGAPIAVVTTSKTWDDDSRLTSQIDDLTNATRYAYDALNRRIVMQLADGTLEQAGTGATWLLAAPAPNLAGFTNGFDVHDNAVTMTDANGSVLSNAYDRLNRLTARAITPGAGVAGIPLGATQESYDYDGLSRVVRAQDDDSLVVRRYDSLSNLILDQQTLNGSPAQTVTSSHDGQGNQVVCNYPGGRVLTNTYDALDRLQQVADAGGVIATYNYIGRTRVERRELGNGTRTDYLYDGIPPNPANDFGVRRVVRVTQTRIAGGVILDDRTFTWDQMDNKTQRKDVRVGGPGLTFDYQYDSIDRLVHSEKTPLVGPPAVTQYGLDGAGNRTNVTGGAHPGTYARDATLPEPADRQSNQYTTTPVGSHVYDAQGNLTVVNPAQPNQRTFLYDYRNQLVQVTNMATATLTTYAYDALGRRIRKTVNAQFTRYLYDDLLEIEEQDAAANTQASYVYGLCLDEVLTMRRGAADFYYHGDDLHNVVAVTDATAAVVERYEYDDFGEPAFFTGSGTPLAASAIGNPLLFTGRRYDPETGYYHYRSRHLDPVTGRFISRDAIGLWGDPGNLGNAFTYVANSPAVFLDPSGYGKLIAGVSGSLDFCMNFCKGDWTISGWLWAGVGYQDSIFGRKVWVGWGQTWSANKIASGNSSHLKWFNCNQCNPNCRDTWLLDTSVSAVKEIEKTRGKGKKKKEKV